MVVPLSDCWARPPGGRGSHLLVDHLTKVARTCGDPGGRVDERIGFLAGLLHDAAKCHKDWQSYIRGQLRKGPPHAPFGAALFAFCAHKLLRVWCAQPQERDAYTDSLLEWVVALHGHHGRLVDLEWEDPPWEASGAWRSVAELVEGCPLDEVFALVAQHWPQFEGFSDGFSDWLDDFPEEWGRWVRVQRLRQRRQSQLPPEVLATRLPNASARLIWADRSEAGGYVDSSALTPEEARAASRHLTTYCRKRAEAAVAEGASRQLVDSRRQLQEAALKGYRRRPEQNLYTLQVATGYGKTLTALRLGLEACRRGRCERILYVAPYLSILSQAANEIGQASGLAVVEHHHLALLERYDPKRAEEAKEQADDQDCDALDSWRAPVLATTFNQLFRALFPQRAQHTLRLSAMDRAFLIVDEPQIIDTGVWNLFLSAMQAHCAGRGCQAILATATLPPLFAGLSQEPEHLAPALPEQNRFRVESLEPILDAGALAQVVVDERREAISVALVVNTVRDAVEVYQALRKRLGDGTSLFCLTALLLPGHKTKLIGQIAHELRNRRPLVAVCTQILEAGVDLSFQRILRARPIFPCIAQVAGRANRHGEGQQGVVRVFSMRRADGRDVRPLVYRDETARRQTDRLLDQRPMLSEPEMASALHNYFACCWQENPQTQALERLERAALGEWSALAGLQPFGADYPKASVFVPLSMGLKPQIQRVLRNLAPDGPRQLLERAADRKLRSQLSFAERKRQSLLVRQFCVPTPYSVAERVAVPFNDWLWELAKASDYSAETGLAHHLLDTEDDGSFFV